MKNLLIILLFSLPSFSFGNDDIPDILCETPAVPTILNYEQIEMLEKISDQSKIDFKRRPHVNSSYQVALNIETNFEAPLVGKDPYWGTIYFKDQDESNIYYRDDLNAEEHFKEERANPKYFWQSTYKTQDINSAKGLSLVKAMGAEVNVKSVGAAFSPKNGGRINIRVKAPKADAFNLLIDVKRNGKNISKELIVGDNKIAFDSFKINASRNMFGISILNGVASIQFMKGGQIVYQINK